MITPADPARAAEAALVQAAAFGHTPLVRWLLERGVDPNGAPRRGQTAMHEAAFAGHLAIVECLLDHGGDPGLRERQWGASVLGWAIEGKRDEVRELLLKRSEPDILDATELGRIERVRAILDAEPDQVHGPDGRGAPLRIAAYQGRVDLCRLLLERGADPGAVDDAGRDALHYARLAGHVEVVVLLTGRDDRRSSR